MARAGGRNKGGLTPAVACSKFRIPPATICLLPVALNNQKAKEPRTRHSRLVRSWNEHSLHFTLSKLEYAMGVTKPKSALNSELQ